jgi:hypothetical protein
LETRRMSEQFLTLTRQFAGFGVRAFEASVRDDGAGWIAFESVGVFYFTELNLDAFPRSLEALLTGALSGVAAVERLRQVRSWQSQTTPGDNGKGLSETRRSWAREKADRVWAESQRRDAARHAKEAKSKDAITNN